MKNFIKRMVERLYYKCYPDRFYDHDIATMPIPIIREERYKPTVYHVATYAYDFDDIPFEYIRKDLVSKLQNAIENEMEISKERDYSSGIPKVRYVGTIRVLRNEIHRESTTEV